MKKLHLLLAIGVISWLASMASAQSVADLARQERARKKALESKAVLTNASQPASAPETAKAGAPSTTEQKEPAKSAAATGPTDNKGRDEKYWRETFQKARQDLKRAQDKLTLLDLKMNDLQGQLYREGVYTREQEIRQSIEQTQKDQAAAREEVEASEKRISDLEDELRRSGGLPSWAR